MAGAKERGGWVERERAMERKVVVVCVAVGLLGLLSAALGFAAEGTRIKVSQISSF